MLAERCVVIDFEGFKPKESDFIIKELAICGEYKDSCSFLPPHNFKQLSAYEQKAFTWVTKSLHGLSWEEGDYPYLYLEQILQSISLRNPLSTFYAKGSEKCLLLEKLLDREVENLENLGCPKVADITCPQYISACYRHSKYIIRGQADRHCAIRKAELFLYWLQNHADFGQKPENTDSIIESFSTLRLNSPDQATSTNNY